MLKSEFEEMIGKEVDEEVYAMYESMYMATNIDKSDFVKLLNVEVIPMSDRQKRAIEEREKTNQEKRQEVEELKAQIKKEEDEIKEGYVYIRDIKNKKEYIKNLKSQINEIKLIYNI